MIPRKHTGTSKRQFKDHGITRALAALKVGQSTVIPRRFWGSVRVISDRLGIKTVTRSLGSANRVTVYRIAARREPLTREQLVALRDSVQRRKGRHRRTRGCEMPHTCGACHFFSGYIQALTDILDNHNPTPQLIPPAPSFYSLPRSLFMCCGWP